MSEKYRYIVTRTQNRDSGRLDYVSYDVILREKDGFKFVAEFENKSDAELFANIKNK